MNYSIIASTLSGNKGAAAMLEASIQSITHKDPSAQFSLFSYLPVKEEKAKNSYDNLIIMRGSPLYLGLVINPLALLHKIIPPLRPLIQKNHAIRTLLESEVLLDQGGITFVDGREKFLLYNVASILPAILLGTKVVKCSQAMGPFNGFINKTVAKLLLPRVTKIMARGEQTEKYLNNLGLKNVLPAADYAFSLDVTSSENKKGRELLKKYGLSQATNKDLVCICPSQVVRVKCEELGVDYSGIMAHFIDDIQSSGYRVLVLPHSAREHTQKTHNNDIPICDEIIKKVTLKNSVIFMNEEISAQAQRYIISKSRFGLVSRFHAMIACLSVSTPVAVIGWSHKYQEVLQQFDLEDYAVDLSKLSPQKLKELLKKLDTNHSSISKKINKHIPAVKKSSSLNTIAVLEAAQNV